MLGRGKFLIVRLTDQERALLHEMARIEQTTLSGLVRLWLRSAAAAYGIWRPPLPAEATPEQEVADGQ